jgi:hypothetical protein
MRSSFVAAVLASEFTTGCVDPLAATEAPSAASAPGTAIELAINVLRDVAMESSARHSTARRQEKTW